MPLVSGGGGGGGGHGAARLAGQPCSSSEAWRRGPSGRLARLRVPCRAMPANQLRPSSSSPSAELIVVKIPNDFSLPESCADLVEQVCGAVGGNRRRCAAVWAGRRA